MDQRTRINAKQTSKGDWYLDVTVEFSGQDIITQTDQAKVLSSTILTTQNQLVADGMNIIK
jgi:hypothetical protein